MATPEELKAARKLLSDDERERVAAWDGLTAECFKAMAEKRASMTITMPTMQVLELVQEIQDRHPRNMSRLVRDDHIDQLHEVITRLHEEVNYLIAFGPSLTVAERFNQVRPKPSRKIPISDELRRTLKP